MQIFGFLKSGNNAVNLFCYIDFGDKLLLLLLLWGLGGGFVNFLVVVVDWICLIIGMFAFVIGLRGGEREKSADVNVFHSF